MSLKKAKITLTRMQIAGKDNRDTNNDNEGGTCNRANIGVSSH